MAPNSDETYHATSNHATSKTCCCCGEEFHERVESYAVICERCVNLWDETSQTA
jgi:transposase